MPSTAWWNSGLIRAALLGIVSWVVAYLSNHGFSVPIDGSQIVDAVITLIGAGVGVYTIVRRIQKPVQPDITPAVFPANVKKMQNQE